MKERIAASLSLPQWARRDERYRRLDMLDRLLDGTFYDDLRYSFYDETEPNGRYIPVVDRRPSARYNMPRMVSKGLSRKLFAGRYSPRIIHPDRELREAIAQLVQETNLLSIMEQAATWGSVGAVAITFKFLVDTAPTGERESRLIVTTYRAKECCPTFNAFGDLSRLRVQRVVQGSILLDEPYGMDRDWANKPVDPLKTYWFVRDFTREDEVTYLPIREHEWRPCEVTSPKLCPFDLLTFRHQMGFVPGHWFLNLNGGQYPDGSCTWEPAIPLNLEMDYTLSMLGRGIRYNSSPQLVIKGRLLNFEEGEGGTIIKGPANYLAFAADQRDSEGNLLQGGDAKLLEMTGQGIQVGIDHYVHKCRQLALEQISATRRDPDRVRVLSGAAIEVMDQDLKDLVGELRTSWGDEGYLKLMRKILLAGRLANHPKLASIRPEEMCHLSIQWPKLEDISAGDLFSLTSGLSVAVEKQLLTHLECRELLKAQLDLALLTGRTEEELEETLGQPGVLDEASGEDERADDSAKGVEDASRPRSPRAGSQ